MAETTRMVVLGAGTMGHGIAQVAAQSGFETVLVDVEEGLVQRGLARIRENLDKGVERGKVEASAREAALARLSAATDLAKAAAGADVVVEAAPERMELKRAIFDTLSAHAPKDAILATNTSSLSISRIAEGVARPERVIGMHFFNPPWVLTLLEIVQGRATSEETLTRTREIGARLGRDMIVVSKP